MNNSVVCVTKKFKYLMLQKTTQDGKLCILMIMKVDANVYHRI